MPDECDIDSGYSLDGNLNGIPDECDHAGDLNCDQLLNMFDIDPFVLVLLSSPPARSRPSPISSRTATLTSPQCWGS